MTLGLAPLELEHVDDLFHVRVSLLVSASKKVDQVVCDQVDAGFQWIVQSEIESFPSKSLIVKEFDGIGPFFCAYVPSGHEHLVLQDEGVAGAALNAQVGQLFPFETLQIETFSMAHNGFIIRPEFPPADTVNVPVAEHCWECVPYFAHAPSFGDCSIAQIINKSFFKNFFKITADTSSEKNFVVINATDSLEILQLKRTGNGHHIDFAGPVVHFQLERFNI